MKLELWMSWVGGILSAILSFFVAIFVAAWICKHSKRFELHLDQNLFEWTIGFLAFAIFIGTIVGTSFHELYDKINPISVEEKVIYQPVSMNNVIASEGEQKWTYIRIDGEQFYTFYYKDGDGYKMGKISAENAIVYQTDDVKPRILKKTTRKACGKFLSSDYEIYIPKGSSIEKFNIDSN